MRSVHDNNIYAYCVICDERRIVLHTEYRERSLSEYTDVIFDGVEAHWFQDQLAGNIVLDIEEAPIESIVKANAQLLIDRKKWGWPKIEFSDLEELVERLCEKRLRGFELSASYGMCGWVLATGMTVVERSARNTSLYTP